MRSRLSRVVLSTVAAGMLAASLATGSAFADHSSQQVITVQMTGAAEVPSAGSPSGWGKAQIIVDERDERVCWNLWSGGTDTPTAAHIHAGEDGEAGPVVIPLSPPVDGASTGCIYNVDLSLVKGLLQNPGGYYVNIHTAKYPGGALRGQLGDTAKSLKPAHAVGEVY
jgi:hypothetical protein